MLEDTKHRLPLKLYLNQITFYRIMSNRVKCQHITGTWSGFLDTDRQVGLQRLRITFFVTYGTL